ncbi:hypothetical protein F4819DRAFT_114588 [Hypoxylon fuscum]|nr:hypothetical protein F4819DRAFT_114588 [Hypoxylon fuscum]
MLVREIRRLILVIAPLFLLFYAGLHWLGNRPSLLSSYHHAGIWLERVFFRNGLVKHHEKSVLADQEVLQSSSSSHSRLEVLPTDDDNGNYGSSHVVLFSAWTLDKRYFQLKFGDKLGINPNIIPHPLLENTWIIVAQQHDPEDTTHMHFVELACDAAFDEINSELRCLFPPVQLPISPTGLGKCEGELEYANMNVGPHDARVFYGPRTPFTVYGSNSQETCFGQWIQDLQVLMNWGNGPGLDLGDTSARELVKEQETFFQQGTELHRPPPYFPIEKNWFIFWDPGGQMYAHYDVFPRRVFAKLGADGSAGPDLAPEAALAGDQMCMNKYMPKLGPEHESIHQATNSLSVTLCRRSDPSCSPTDANTFLFTIFQHKTFYGFHGVYEPYVVVFRRRAPFQVYGISRKPLWIYGRARRSQMLYVTSVSWKAHDRKYHGYLDDVLFLGFGIEDQDAAAIDVLASDLLVGLGLCEEVHGSSWF